MAQPLGVLDILLPGQPSEYRLPEHADQRLAAMRMLLSHAERSPDPAYRAYQQRLSDYNCGFAARIHNATTPAQRQQALETLKGWEEDLRSLAAPPG